MSLLITADYDELVKITNRVCRNAACVSTAVNCIVDASKNVLFIGGKEFNGRALNSSEECH